MITVKNISKTFKLYKTPSDRLMEKGMLTADKEMVMEALDIKFSSNVPEDIHKKINALNNRILLKKLHRSTFQSKNIDGFRKILQELPPEQMQVQ